VLGLVRGDIRDRWRMSGPVAAAEIAVAPLVARVFEDPAAQPVPGYPSIRRDMAIVVDETVSHAELVGAIREAGCRELTAVELFDIFRGEEIGKRKKSLAYSLEYRSMDRTLTDEEANGFHEAVKDALRARLDVRFREG
jgi:phenylalanyl-tRNA synthetase beta chain